MAVEKVPEWVEAVIFDLDGTLVETELLKARSYAKIAQDLNNCTGKDRLGVLDSSMHCTKVIDNVVRESPHIINNEMPAPETEGQRCADAAMKVFLSNLGATSEFIARLLVDELHLAEPLKPHMERFGETEPWKALYKLRKETYYESFATEENLYESRYPAALHIVEIAEEAGIPLAVATSSSTADAERVLKALRVRDSFKFVLGRDQVAKAKPEPEIYLKSAGLLDADPAKCLVFEDSPTGVKAGTAAGMNVVAIASAFTKDVLKEQSVLSHDYVAWEPDMIWPIVSALKA